MLHKTRTTTKGLTHDCVKLVFFFFFFFFAQQVDSPAAYINFVQCFNGSLSP